MEEITPDESVVTIPEDKEGTCKPFLTLKSLFDITAYPLKALSC
jgi:hypothetical protein